MKHLPLLLRLSLLLTGCLAHAAITIPGITGTPAAGSDLAFNPANSLTVDLSLAPTAAWDAVAPAPGNGVYDPEKWAVVFKYDSVNIPAGVTVTFKNNASRAPVVWLVSGDVTINGRVSLNGAEGNVAAIIAPGPGGFRGGKGHSGVSPASSGFGPGGARPGRSHGLPVTEGNGASHAARGGPFSGPTYGDADVRLFLGGSGGGGRADNREIDSGGGGGGAFLLVVQGRVAVNGQVTANGGYAEGAGGGSGGAVRIVAEEISGNGSISAVGGPGNSSSSNNHGSPGFIKAEALTFSGDIQTFPQAKVETLNGPVRLWPDAGAPFVRIVSAGGRAVPADPKAAFGLAPADVDVPAGSRTIVVETRNLPPTAEVTIFVIPHNGARFELPATHMAGDLSLSTWEAALSDNATGRFALQVRAVSP